VRRRDFSVAESRRTHGVTTWWLSTAAREHAAVLHLDVEAGANCVLAVGGIGPLRASGRMRRRSVVLSACRSWTKPPRAIAARCLRPPPSDLDVVARSRRAEALPRTPVGHRRFSVARSTAVSSPATTPRRHRCRARCSAVVTPREPPINSLRTANDASRSSSSRLSSRSEPKPPSPFAPTTR
jgi:hypothetical protein